jgi:hypothetical protein
MKIFLIIKPIFFICLTAGFLLFLLSSCATVSVEPLASGELRLLKIQLEGTDDIREDFPVKIAVNFEADGKPEITTICFYWGENGHYFYKNFDVDYGPPGTIRIEIPARVAKAGKSSSDSLGSYVMYLREGKPLPSNIVKTSIRVIAR